MLLLNTLIPQVVDKEQRASALSSPDTGNVQIHRAQHPYGAGTQYLLWICLHARERSNEFQGLSSVFAEDQISLPRSNGLKDEKL